MNPLPDSSCLFPAQRTSVYTPFYHRPQQPTSPLPPKTPAPGAKRGTMGPILNPLRFDPPPSTSTPPYPEGSKMEPRPCSLPHQARLPPIRTLDPSCGSTNTPLEAPLSLRPVIPHAAAPKREDPNSRLTSMTVSMSETNTKRSQEKVVPKKRTYVTPEKRLQILREDPYVASVNELSNRILCYGCGRSIQLDNRKANALHYHNWNCHKKRCKRVWDPKDREKPMQIHRLEEASGSKTVENCESHDICRGGNFRMIRPPSAHQLPDNCISVG